MPKRVPPLNVRSLERWKPSGPLDELVDGAVPGLRARQSNNGVVWSLNVVVGDKRRRIMVGAGLSLADARRRAETMRTQISDGFDPSIERQERKARLRAATEGVGTLRSVLGSYFHQRSELRSGAKQRQLLTAVLAQVLDRPAMNLTPPQVQLAIDDYAGGKSKVSAARGVTYGKPFFKWASKRGLMQKGFDELEAPLEPPKKQTALNMDQVAAFLRSLDDGPRDRAALTMLMTGTRLNEVCEATWPEFDLDKALWTIPGARRKNVRPGRSLSDHIVPLPRQLVALLKAIGPGEPGALAFPAPRDWQRWGRQKRAQLKFDITPHALRRTCATMLGELGEPPHVIEAMLGHAAIASALAAAYNKSRYTAEIGAALQKLADRLDVLVAGGNVVMMPRRA